MTLSEAGTLSEKIDSDQKYKITSLKVSGPINGTDVRYLRQMAGREYNCENTNGSLVELDLTDAKIVEGGDYYLLLHSSSRYYTKNDTIGDYMFYDCNLKNIKLPNSVTSIGSYAFLSCSSLTSITIPNSVTSIGYDAFGSELKKVIMFPNTIPSGLSSAFNANYSGMIYVANNNYDKISGLGTVKVYPHLSSLFEVDGVVYVPVNPSQRTCDVIDCNYNDTIGNIVVPQTVSYKGVTMYPQDVNDYSFYKWTKSGEAILSNNGYVGNYAFYGCENLKSVNLTDSLTTIGRYAFGTTGLKHFSFPANLTSLGSSAFSDCANLESVKINGKLINLSSGLFFGCSSLSGISIPANIKSVEDDAFDGCSSLATLIIENDTDTLSLGNSNSKSSLFEDCPLDSVYVGTHISYNTSSDYSYSPFYRNTTLRAVRLGDNVSQVYDNEFYGCTGLKTAIIGENVTEIGNYAFSGCSSIESFLFGKNVKTIGNEAFSDCTALTKLESHSATPPTCGTEALDDINKWDCTLYVPQNSLTAYQSADQWKEFFFIEAKETTGISQVRSNNANTVVRRYDSSGRLLKRPSAGLNILKMSDGTTKKVLVK